MSLYRLFKNRVIKVDTREFAADVAQRCAVEPLTIFITDKKEYAICQTNGKRINQWLKKWHKIGSYNRYSVASQIVKDICRAEKEIYDNQLRKN